MAEIHGSAPHRRQAHTFALPNRAVFSLHDGAARGVIIPSEPERAWLHAPPAPRPVNVSFGPLRPPPSRPHRPRSDRLFVRTGARVTPHKSVLEVTSGTCCCPASNHPGCPALPSRHRPLATLRRSSCSPSRVQIPPELRADAVAASARKVRRSPLTRWQHWLGNPADCLSAA